MSAWLLITALMGGASLLSGCASLRTASVEASSASSPLLLSRPIRATITTFDIEGRISVRQGDKHHTAHLDWHHEPAHDRLLLTTPLGQGMAELTRDHRGAHLQLSDRRIFEAVDMETLAQRLFDIDLPLSLMPRWIVGQVAPAIEPNQDDRLGRPQWRQIDGWRLTYMDYESPAAHALPVLMEMQQLADDIDVRLKIDRWQLSP